MSATCRLGATAVESNRQAMPDEAPQGLDLHYGHPRMPLSERAKIFIPFQALRGLDDALRKEEQRLRKEQQE